MPDAGTRPAKPAPDAQVATKDNDAGTEPGDDAGASDDDTPIHACTDLRLETGDVGLSDCASLQAWRPPKLAQSRAKFAAWATLRDGDGFAALVGVRDQRVLACSFDEHGGLVGELGTLPWGDFIILDAAAGSGVPVLLVAAPDRTGLLISGHDFLPLSRPLDTPAQMALTKNGRILVGGSSRTASGAWKVWLQSLDRSGAVQSENEYEAAAPLAELVTENDAIYALTSTSVVRGSATPTSRIVAIQPDGLMPSDRIVFELDVDLYAIEPLPDGEICAVGWADTYPVVLNHQWARNRTFSPSAPPGYGPALGVDFGALGLTAVAGRHNGGQWMVVYDLERTVWENAIDPGPSRPVPSVQWQSNGHILAVVDQPLGYCGQLR